MLTLTEYQKKDLEFRLQEHELWLRSKHAHGHRFTAKDQENLEKIDLSFRDLRDATFNFANLKNASFTGANLAGASFYSANCIEADFDEANLYLCDFRFAKLNGARFYKVNAVYAKFSYAVITDAHIGQSNFFGANLANTTPPEVKGFPGLVCPGSGSFTAFKAVMVPQMYDFDKWIIAELRIPEHAKRGSATTRKCRASEAEVVRFWNLDHTPADVTIAISSHDSWFAYIIGNTVRPTTEFNTNRWNECSSGIHFFMTFEEAVDYTNC